MVEIHVQSGEQLADRPVPVTQDIKKLFLLENLAVNENLSIQIRDHDGQPWGCMLQHILPPLSADESRVTVNTVYCEIDVINGFDGGIPDLIKIVIIKECGFLMYSLLDTGGGCHQ
jgi:hypothetical protein